MWQGPKCKYRRPDLRAGILSVSVYTIHQPSTVHIQPMYMLFYLTLLGLKTNLHMSGSPDILQEGTVLGQVMSIVNNKGGVGKTTVTVNLAHALTRRGQRVLVVDLDSQCNATSILLPRVPGGNTLYEVFTESELNVGQCIYPTEYEKLFCLPNTNDTSALEPPLLKSLPESFRIIRDRIRAYAQQHYDFALLDCPPNMGFFVVSALHASDFVIVPIWAGSAFSVEGLLKAIHLIDDIRANGNPDLRFLRLLVNQVDRRTAMTKVSIDQLNKNFSAEQIFHTMIPVNAAFQRAENEGKTIIRYDPTMLGAKAYRSLAKELLEIFSVDGTEEP
jgi:chromosome partitioning protein